MGGGGGNGCSGQDHTHPEATDGKGAHRKQNRVATRVGEPRNDWKRCVRSHKYGVGSACITKCDMGWSGTEHRERKYERGKTVTTFEVASSVHCE